MRFFKEFTSGGNIASKARWLYAGFGESLGTPGDNHPNFHGSCMLSKVAGATLGTAKKITPILVQVKTPFSPYHYLDALNKVSRDFGTGDGTGKTQAVVLMAWNYGKAIDRGGITDAWIKEIIVVLNELAGKGVFLVTGSGNGLNDVSS